MVAWYTTAWFDKYVKGDASADRRLLTKRWQSDSLEAAIDPNHDGNMFSFYYPLAARHRAGRRRWVRVRGPAQPAVRAWSSDDGRSGGYSYLEVATTPDG